MLIDQLRRTFAERCRKNPTYSLRAFSRAVGMDSSTVSAIMNGKRPLTIKTARRLLKGLDIVNPVEVQNIMAGTFLGDKEDDVLGYKQLSLEAAEAISFWQHFAILALLEIKDFRATERTISERLNIPFGIVLESMDRLEKLGLITRAKIGWVLTGKNMSTPTDVPSAMLREGHRQYIHKALESLENDPVEVRDVTGMTMAITKARLPQAKKLIQEFRRKMSAYLEDGTRDAVYRLNVQLFPISQEKKK
jgi:transcriptional regulator with XRE-family HTH domain